MKSDQFEKAIKVLRNSLKEEPAQVELYSRIGEAQLALGKLDSAIASVELAHKLMPQSSAVHSALAFFLMLAGLIDNAKVHLDSSVILVSNNPQAHRLLCFYFARFRVQFFSNISRSIN
mgnify:CR=1 FL=1